MIHMSARIGRRLIFFNILYIRFILCRFLRMRYVMKPIEWLFIQSRREMRAAQRRELSI